MGPFPEINLIALVAFLFGCIAAGTVGLILVVVMWAGDFDVNWENGLVVVVASGLAGFSVEQLFRRME